MKNRFFAASALVGFTLLSSTSSAFALCAPAPSDGGTVTCSSNDVTGVSASGNTGLTVNIDGGVDVTVAGDAISIGNGTVNVGAGANVESTAAIAIRTGAGTSNINISDGATLVSNGQGIFYDAAGGTGSVVFGNNTSLTSGSGTSIQFGIARAQLTITDTTTISGTVNTGVATNDSFTYNDANGSTFDTTRFADKYFNFEQFNKGGVGVTTLTGAEAKNWSINAGTLATTDLNVNGVSIGASGTLRFDDVDGTYTGSVLGTGTWNILNGSILTLGGNNNNFSGTLNINTNNNITVGSANALSGASTINIDQSTLTFSAGLTAANNFVIGINDATFDTGANNVTLSGNITGGAGHTLIKAGSGRLTLGGTNAYGNAIVSAGTLQGTTNSLVGNIALGNNTLTFDQSITGTYAGTITGNMAAIEKNGTGTVNLTGDISGLTLTSFDINAGRVNFNNVGNGLVSALVKNGAVGGGTGTVGIIQAEAGGTIAPGNSIGTLYSNAFIIFDAGSHYEVEYNASGQSDLAVAGSNISINSAAILDLVGAAGSYANSTTYTILQSSGGTISGTFGTVNNNLAFLDPTMIYNAASVQVRMDRNDVAFADIARDAPQSGTANAITDLGAGNEIYDSFSGVTVEQGRDALDQLSGESVSTSILIPILSNNVILTYIQVKKSQLKHLSQAVDYSSRVDVSSRQKPASQDPSVYVSAYMYPAANDPSRPARNWWIEGLGSIGETDQHDTSPQQDRYSIGMAGGLTHIFDNDLTMVVYAGYETGRIKTSSQNATSDLANYSLGAIFSRDVRDVTLTGGVALGYHDIETHRYIDLTSDTASGDTNGYTVAGFVEASKGYKINDTTALEPYVGFSLARSHIDSYTETGSVGNLVVGDSNETVPVASVGVRAAKSISTAATQFTLSGNVGWQYTFGDLESTNTSRFATGTQSFEVEGAGRTRHALTLGLGIDANVGAGMKAYTSYSGALSHTDQDHGFKAGLKVDF